MSFDVTVKRRSVAVDTLRWLGEGFGVGWERALLELFDDLEQQAEGLALAQRDADVAELARAEYSEVDLASRLHASVGHEVELTVLGAGPVRGRLGRVGAGWCLVVNEGPGPDAVVSLSALLGARGLSHGARPEPLRGVAARLGLGSVVRRLAEEGGRVTVVRTDGERRGGVLARVGADFLELAEEGRLELVPFAAVAVLRG
ncbi:hypothetical protein [Nocardioides caldifontis]|uniref:hypothetical protein n=1 Tax=Nocardioides caldifontis TaxID=2588938 RepID=UPI001EF07816|nr:hypothetical protein [Nocardioides caldifontis]